MLFKQTKMHRCSPQHKFSNQFLKFHKALPLITFKVNFLVFLKHQQFKAEVLLLLLNQWKIFLKALLLVWDKFKSNFRHKMMAQDPIAMLL